MKSDTLACSEVIEGGNLESEQKSKLKLHPQT